MSHTLADVLRAPIDFDPLPAQTPAPIRELLRRCLDRDLKTRLRDIGEARIAIQKWLANPVAETAPHRRGSDAARLGWAVSAVAVVLAVALAVLAFVHFREKPPVAELIRFQIPLPEKSSVRGRSVSLAGWPPRGLRRGRSGRTPGPLGTAARFARVAAPDRHGSSVQFQLLVARQPLPGVRGAGQVEEGGSCRRPAADSLRRRRGMAWRRLEPRRQ